jgi:type VI secretion system protein ImpI
MFISLQINNVDVPPAGVLLGYRSRDRSFEIGRENCDWSCPIQTSSSGRHCEVRYKGGGSGCMTSRAMALRQWIETAADRPHRLGQGDWLRIGRYVVSVSIDDGKAVHATGNVERPRLDAKTDARPAAHGPERAMPAPLQAPPAAPVSGQPTEAEEILRKIAIGAGIPPEALLLRDGQEVATEIGLVLRIVVEELVLLLKARAAAKVLAKSSDRTMINAADNNPLKFVPGTDEILEIMFARRRAGYLDARHSIEDAFHDLKTHEFATFAAMQAALSRLLDDLSPGRSQRGFSVVLRSKKGRAWDAFVATWRTKEEATKTACWTYSGLFQRGFARRQRE